MPIPENLNYDLWMGPTSEEPYAEDRVHPQKDLGRPGWLQIQANFPDIYTVEKIETKQGWTDMTPDEGWFNGYQQEMEASYRTAAYGDPLESDSGLASDTLATIYSAYLSAERRGAEVPIAAL